MEGAQAQLRPVDARAPRRGRVAVLTAMCLFVAVVLWRVVVGGVSVGWLAAYLFEGVWFTGICAWVLRAGALGRSGWHRHAFVDT